MGKEAIVIDPSIYVDQYIKKAEELGAQVKHVVDTHRHADHVSGASELIKENWSNILCARRRF